VPPKSNSLLIIIIIIIIIITGVVVVAGTGGAPGDHSNILVKTKLHLLNLPPDPEAWNIYRN